MSVLRRHTTALERGSAMTTDTDILAADLKGLQLIVKALLNRLTAVEAKLTLVANELEKLKNGRAK